MVDANEATEEEEFTLFAHLAELRKRVVRGCLVVVAFFIVAFVFSEQLIVYLSGPLMDSLPKDAGGLHFTGPLDVFFTCIKVSLIVGVVVSSPVWLYQFWKFFETIIDETRKKYVLPFLVVSLVQFFLGLAFCYFLILPMTLEFLIGMGLEVGTAIITIKDYFSILILLVFGFGLVFEGPVILVLLASLGIISSELLTDHRRIFVVANLVVSAILTPSPDPFTQLAMAIPLYIMFEASILIIKAIEKRRAEPVAVAT